MYMFGCCTCLVAVQDPKHRLKTMDLLFLIDSTTSMIPMMKAAKAKIMDIVQQNTSAPPPLDGRKVRLGFIAYSDFGVKPQFEIQDFMK